jgi:hypothetical protein
MKPTHTVTLRDHVEFLNAHQVWPVLGAQTPICKGDHFNNSLYETDTGNIELVSMEIRNNEVGMLTGQHSNVFNPVHNIIGMCNHDYFVELYLLDNLCAFCNRETFSASMHAHDFTVTGFLAGLFASTYLTPALHGDENSYVFKPLLEKLAKSYHRFGDIFVLDDWFESCGECDGYLHNQCSTCSK